MDDFAPACYTAAIISYKPLYGDYLIWSKWFSTWHGFLIDFKNPDKCTFVIAGLPILLVSTNNNNKSIKNITLEQIRNSKGGQFTIMRHTNDRQLPIWYV